MRNSRHIFCLSSLFHHDWVIMREQSLLHYKCSCWLSCKQFVYNTNSLAVLKYRPTFFTLAYTGLWIQLWEVSPAKPNWVTVCQQNVTGTDSEWFSPCSMTAITVFPAPRHKSKHINWKWWEWFHFSIRPLPNFTPISLYNISISAATSAFLSEPGHIMGWRWSSLMVIYINRRLVYKTVN